MTFFMSPFSIPIVAIVGVFVYLCISALANSVQAIVKHRNEVELKQQLADRGMSADEIERVVLATSVKEEVEQLDSLPERTASVRERVRR